MATESDLRDALRGAGSPPSPHIDAEAVVRRARLRRTPRQVAFGSLAVLAIGGVTTIGVTAIPRLLPSSMSASDTLAAPEAWTQYGDSGGADPGGPPAGSAPSCVMALPEVRSEATELTLSASFPASAPASGPVSGTVTLTNTGASRLIGTIALPVVVILAQGGATVWHGDGATDSTQGLVDLAPGESLSYPVSFTPVDCAAGDADGESGTAFREGLPALPAGRYEVSAVIGFVPDAGRGSGGAAGIELIGGPAEIVELR